MNFYNLWVTFLLDFARVSLYICIMFKPSSCGKRQYQTRKDALIKARQDQKPYYCDECEAWHLKTQEE